MKKVLLTTSLVIAYCYYLAAQTPLQRGSEIPQGSVVYALPSTTIEIQAEAVHELFTAGPYARYSQKYLGIEAEAANKEIYYLKSLALKTTIEADAIQIYALEVKDKNAAANFLRFSSEGLIVSLDQAGSTPANFQFSNATPAAFADKGVEANIGSEKVTLYKTVQTDSGFEKVPVQQNQTVEKNPEKRAEEAANVIFTLRKKRIELITGDVEGALSKDGLQAALNEIKRLEDEYLSLFIGKTTSDVQSAVFYVTPAASQAKQLYVAFRFSDTQGLLQANNVAGRPVTLELTPEKKAAEQPSNAADNSGKQPRVAYRMPEAVQARINDGQNTLLQTRLLVYQLGRTMTFPANLQVK